MKWSKIGLFVVCALSPTTSFKFLERGDRLSPLSIADALGTRSLGDLSRMALSPDGKWIAYMVRDNRRAVSLRDGEEKYFEVYTGIHAQNRFSDMWVANTETGEARRLTGGKDSSWGPSWSPDGHYLAFVSDRDGSGQTRIWVWEPLTGVLRMISSANVRENLFDDIEWSPDSQRVLVPAIPEGLSVDEYARRAFSSEVNLQPKASDAPGSTVDVYESATGSSGQGVPLFNLNAYFRDLISIEVRTGKMRIVVQGRKIRSYLISPTGSHVAYAVPKRFEKPGSVFVVYDLMVSDLSGAEGHVIASGIALDDFSWSPDGSLLAYGAYQADEKGYDYYVVDPSAASVRKVSSLPSQPPCCSFPAPAWSAKGDSFYFPLNGALWRTTIAKGTSEEVGRVPDRQIQYLLRQSRGLLWTLDDGISAVVLVHDEQGKQDGFYRIDLQSGASTRMLEERQCYTSRSSLDSGAYLTTVSADGKRIGFSAEDAERPADVWVADASFARVRQLTHLNPQFEKRKLGSVRIIEWLSDDGERLRGALLLPPSYEEGRKCPLIVYVYPGTALSDFAYQFGFGEYPGPLNMQLFATRGYAVLFPDSRAAPTDAVGSLGKSVLPGVNKVVEMGIADSDAIGVIGHSFGGYGVMALITWSGRFKAAMEISGSADITADYGAMSPDGSSYGNRRGELLTGGTPVQYPLRYLLNSPVYYFDRVQTPLLVVHGSRDDAAPIFLADEIFVGLRRLGKGVEYARYKDEPHALVNWSFANQEDVAKRMIAWFDRHLKRE
jgi:dipeptidyl aminopeptidase/acylaminoacyl peptidase